jgi:hypothetical protein
MHECVLAKKTEARGGWGGRGGMMSVTDDCKWLRFPSRSLHTNSGEKKKKSIVERNDSNEMVTSVSTTAATFFSFFP